MAALVWKEPPPTEPPPPEPPPPVEPPPAEEPTSATANSGSATRGGAATLEREAVLLLPTGSSAMGLLAANAMAESTATLTMVRPAACLRAEDLKTLLSACIVNLLDCACWVFAFIGTANDGADGGDRAALVLVNPLPTCCGNVLAVVAAGGLPDSLLSATTFLPSFVGVNAARGEQLRVVRRVYQQRQTAALAGWLVGYALLVESAGSAALGLTCALVVAMSARAIARDCLGNLQSNTQSSWRRDEVGHSKCHGDTLVVLLV